MFDHLKYQGALVVGRTEAGKFTINLLNLNDDETVEYRQMLIDLAKVIEEKVRRLRLTIKELDKMIKVKKNKQRHNELKSIREDQAGDLVKLESHLKKISG